MWSSSGTKRGKPENKDWTLITYCNYITCVHYNYVTSQVKCDRNNGQCYAPRCYYQQLWKQCVLGRISVWLGDSNTSREGCQAQIGTFICSLMLDQSGRQSLKADDEVKSLIISTGHVHFGMLMWCVYGGFCFPECSCWFGYRFNTVALLTGTRWLTYCASYSVLPKENGWERSICILKIPMSLNCLNSS